MGSTGWLIRINSFILDSGLACVLTENAGDVVFWLYSNRTVDSWHSLAAREDLKALVQARRL